MLVLLLGLAFLTLSGMAPQDDQDGSRRAPTPATDRLKEACRPLLGTKDVSTGMEVLEAVERCRRWEAIEVSVRQIELASGNTDLRRLVLDRIPGPLSDMLPFEVSAPDTGSPEDSDLLRFDEDGQAPGTDDAPGKLMPLVPGASRFLARAAADGKVGKQADWKRLPGLLRAVEHDGVVLIEELELSSRVQASSRLRMTLSTLRGIPESKAPQVQVIEEITEQLEKGEIDELKELRNRLRAACPEAPDTLPTVTPTASETLCYIAFAFRETFASRDLQLRLCPGKGDGAGAIRPHLEVIRIDVQPVVEGRPGHVELSGLAPDKAFADHLAELSAATPCMKDARLTVPEPMPGQTGIRFTLEFEFHCPFWTCAPAAAPWCSTSDGDPTMSLFEAVLEVCPENLDSLTRSWVDPPDCSAFDGLGPPPPGMPNGLSTDGPASDPNSTEEAQAPSWQPARPFAEWIVQTKTAGTYKVERAPLLEVIDHPEFLGREARIVPHMTEGKIDGFKVFGMRPTSLYAAAGFRNNDRVTRVNETPLDSPARLAAGTLLPDGTDRIEVELVRQGETVKLVFLLH